MIPAEIDVVAWERWLEAVECGGPFKLRFELMVQNAHDSVLIHVRWDVPDVDTGRMQTQHGCVVVWSHRPDGRAGDYLRRLLVLPLIEHEVDEWLRVGGERVRDPHAHERKAS